MRSDPPRAVLYTGIRAPPVEGRSTRNNEGDLPGAAPSGPATRHIHPMFKSILISHPPARVGSELL